uniref:Uncharacterized protein n=1 Tax=Rhodosorus marinus TaxID=101924 RepID=A0A7S3A153_9RHOD
METGVDKVFDIVQSGQHLLCCLHVSFTPHDEHIIDINRQQTLLSTVYAALCTQHLKTLRAKIMTEFLMPFSPRLLEPGQISSQAADVIRFPGSSKPRRGCVRKMSSCRLAYLAHSSIRISFPQFHRNLDCKMSLLQYWRR